MHAVADPALNLQILVEQLRQQCLEEKVDKHADAVKAYSALTQAPKEWTLEVNDCLTDMSISYH